MATIGQLGRLIADHLHKPVTRVINQEALMVDTFKKLNVKTSSGQFIVSAQVTRNGAVGAVNEGGTLPNFNLLPPNQSGPAYASYVITPASMYSVYQISGQTLAACSGSEDAIDVAKEAVESASEAVINFANQHFFTGQRFLGLIHQKRVAGGAAVDWEFVGDFDKVNTLRTAGGAASLPIQVTRLDTWVDVPGGGALTITAESATARTITITDAGGVGIATNGLAAGAVCAVEAINDAPSNATQIALLDSYPNGIGAGMFQRNMFTVNRMLAANAELRGIALSQETVAPSAFAALSPDRMNTGFALQKRSSGKKLDMLVTGSMTVGEYASLMFQTASLSNDLGATNKKGDIGFESVSFNGIPLFTSRHCPEGQLIGLSREAWKYVELKAPGVEDRDGQTLRYLGGSGGVDSFEGIISWYANIVPMDPHANFILTGIDYPIA